MIPILLTALGVAFAPGDAIPSERARATADHVVESYGDAAIDLLAELVTFETYAHEDGSGSDHPAFRAMTAKLREVAERFGLDFEDHGAVVVIGLGDELERLGLVTHGDVQPADPTKWKRSPFVLDRESEPGRLVGRGTEDDKGPIACALFALRGIRERGVPLARRVELIISYTEESDWAPFIEFLAENPPPSLNVAFDAEYPVVVAEKGWCSVSVSLPAEPATPSLRPVGPTLTSFTGGFFLSQVPEGAEATVASCTPEVERKLRALADRDDAIRWTFERDGEQLTIAALGRSAHSSKPETGVNGITHMAALLAGVEWPPTAAAHIARFIDERCGTGFYGERFGDLAYEDPFMGKLTLSVGTLEVEDGRLVCSINLRRPVGRDRDAVERAIHGAVESWEEEAGVDLDVSLYVGEPHPPQEAGHVPVLLDTFRAYTGIEDAEPISIGGGTHARLVPAGVNFGPAMPGETYTGHTEHEFLTRDQFLLNLRMYTSLIVDLASE